MRRFWFITLVLTVVLAACSAPATPTPPSYPGACAGPCGN